MENISRLQLEKYENILNEINNEHEKHEQLKKNLDGETNKLTALRIAMEETFAREKLFRVLVKVFSSIFELYYIYNEEISKQEFELLQKLTNCNFYLIQVLISKQFLQKVVAQRWLLNVNIKNSKIRVAKTVVISKKHIGGSVFIVVPFNVSVKPSIINTTLFMPLDSYWSYLKISTIVTDISYHFTSQETHSNSKKINPVLKTAHNYNVNIDKTLLSIPTLEYNFKCQCTTKHFFESLIKNSYHRLNPEIISLFTNEASNIITVSFTVDNLHETKIQLNRRENVLTIVSNIRDLCEIKKYFIDEIRCQNVYTDKMWLAALSNMKHYVQAELFKEEINLNNFKILYEEFRKLMFELAV